MSVKAFIPTIPEIGREAIIVLCGALLAALVLQRLPALRTYIAANTGGIVGGAAGGCNCTSAAAPMPGA